MSFCLEHAVCVVLQHTFLWPLLLLRRGGAAKRVGVRFSGSGQNFIFENNPSLLRFNVEVETDTRSNIEEPSPAEWSANSADRQPCPE